MIRKFASYLFPRLNKVLFLWVLAFTLNIITFIFIYYKIKPDESVLALHYNVLTGVDWYGKGTAIYAIPAIGFAITAINFIFYRGLRHVDNFLRPLCAMVSVLFQLILFISALLLLQVN